MCGRTTAVSLLVRASGTLGSCSNTSSAAQPSLPASNAATSAVSSMTGPRAMLTMMPLGPSASRTGWLTRWRVLGPPRVATIRKSAHLARSTSEAS
ncbi:hypothetical protein G6F68_021593 [Rhizopus microsporus]|nr:hypothetical protein G6F68_021593 [Rhizopus microsporus]